MSEVTAQFKDRSIPPNLLSIRVGPQMSGVTRLKQLLSDQTKDLPLIEEVCSHLSATDIMDCLRTYVARAGSKSSKSETRSAVEQFLLKSEKKISCDDLSDMCTAYRMHGIRREAATLVYKAYSIDKIEICDTHDTLKLMRELGLCNVIEHSLFDQLISIERTRILCKSDEDKVEFLRAIGVCHGNYPEDFKLVFDDITPRLSELSAVNMTRLLMGWSQVKHENNVALNYALYHVGDTNSNYTRQQRAIAIKCLCTLADKNEVLKVWDGVEPIFKQSKIKEGSIARELYKSISALDLPIDEKRLQIIKKNASSSSAQWIESTVFEKVRDLTSSIGRTHRMRVKMQTEMAEQTFIYRGKKYAITIDYPTIHRIGGKPDGILCGSQKLRDKIFEQLGFIVIRIPEDLLCKANTKSLFVNFIRSNPDPGIYFYTIEGLNYERI